MSIDDNLVRLRLITHNARLVDARKDKGFNRAEDFAQAISISRGRLHLIENLKVIPTEDEMCKIAVILEKQVEYLFPDALLAAIKRQVFSKRTAELAEPQIIELEGIPQRWLLTDGGLGEVEERLNHELLCKGIDKALSELTAREREVIKLRFGLHGRPAQTLDELVPVFNVTRERIRQIEGKALRKLRHPIQTRKLKGFLD